MKFVIIKVILSLTILSLCINQIFSTKTKTKTLTTLQTATASGIGLGSNYKMTLGNLLAKSHNKAENHSGSQERLYNTNQELERLAAPVAREIIGNQIFFKGWMKYFKYSDSKSNQKPKQFFKNVLYEKETRKRKGNGADKNAAIPSPTHFYGILFADTLNIFTTNDKFSSHNIYDVLNIDYIKSIPEDKLLGGGIRDFGKFSEGFCFQVNTIVPNYVFQSKIGEAEPKSGANETWLICLDDSQSKSSLMNLLIQNKIKKQQAAGLQIKTKSGLQNLIKSASSKSNPNKPQTPSISDLNKKGQGKGKQPRDGRWIVLQDWSQCNLKCGGGEQTLHLICMPPEQGGKPCEGTAIRKRPCNVQPCPVFSKGKGGNQSKPEKYEKPIIKVMPLSNRPTRYEKCNLKENDVFVVLKPQGINLLSELQSKGDSFLGSEVAPKIPLRIVMNNKSISFYKDEQLGSIMLSLALESTTFQRISGNKSCFFLQGRVLSQQAIVCSLSQKPGFAEEWDYDFNLFKNQCNERRPVVKLKDDPEIKKKFTEKITKIKQELIEEKTAKARLQTQKEEELSIKSKVDQTQAMTLLAMQKENKLEQLLEKEEKLREKEEEKELEKQFQAEVKKKDVLMKSIKEKELEEQFNISKENAEIAIKKIKEEAKSTIIKKRTEIKNKIAQMRVKAERKKAAIKSKILSLRTETAQQIQKYTKRGDLNRCFIPNPASKGLPEGHAKAKAIENKPFPDQQSYMEVYCTAAYSNNISKYMECKQPESFCFVCCESEFGQMHLSDRERCYNQRCNKL